MKASTKKGFFGNFTPIGINRRWIFLWKSVTFKVKSVNNIIWHVGRLELKKAYFRIYKILRLWGWIEDESLYENPKRSIKIIFFWTLNSKKSVNNNIAFNATYPRATATTLLEKVRLIRRWTHLLSAGARYRGWQVVNKCTTNCSLHPTILRERNIVQVDIKNRTFHNWTNFRR